MDSLRDNFGKYDVSRLIPKDYVFHQVRVSEALLGPERAITSHAGRLGPGETDNANRPGGLAPARHRHFSLVSQTQPTPDPSRENHSPNGWPLRCCQRDMDIRPLPTVINALSRPTWRHRDI
jgi:hypothetical protein